MDMRAKFSVTIESKTSDFMCETWQEALSMFIDHMNDSGFTVDEKRRLAIIEIARSGKVTI